MLFERILGNIKEINNLDDYQIDNIVIKSDDLEKKILRVVSEKNLDCGISLKESGQKLEDGSILYNDGKKLIVVRANLEKIIVIKPENITQMGEIAHFLGNMHSPINIENGKIYIGYDKYLAEIFKEKGFPYEVEKLRLEKALRHIEQMHGLHGHSHD